VLLFVVGSQLEGENCFKGLLNLYFPFFASYYYIILHSNITVVQAFEAFKSRQFPPKFVGVRDCVPCSNFEVRRPTIGVLVGFLSTKETPSLKGV